MTITPQMCAALCGNGRHVRPPLTVLSMWCTSAPYTVRCPTRHCVAAFPSQWGDLTLAGWLAWWGKGVWGGRETRKTCSLRVWPLRAFWVKNLTTRDAGPMACVGALLLQPLGCRPNAPGELVLGGRGAQVGASGAPGLGLQRHLGLAMWAAQRLRVRTGRWQEVGAQEKGPCLQESHGVLIPVSSTSFYVTTAWCTLGHTHGKRPPKLLPFASLHVYQVSPENFLQSQHPRGASMCSMWVKIDKEDSRCERLFMIKHWKVPWRRLLSYRPPTVSTT